MAASMNPMGNAGRFTVARKDGVGTTETCEAKDLLDVCEKLSEGSRHPLDITPAGDRVTVGDYFDAAKAAGKDVGVLVIPAAPKQNSSFTDRTNGLVKDEEARVRIEAQHSAMRAAGMEAGKGAGQIYDTGTRMADVGYENQANRKQEHDRKSLLRDAAASLVKRVEAEERQDQECSAVEFARALHVNGKVTAFGLSLSEQAIRGLLGRVESPATRYVMGIRDRMAERVAAARAEKESAKLGNRPVNEDFVANLRSENTADREQLADVLEHECRRNPDAALKLRTRRANGDVFAVVSPDYAPADAPEVVAQVLDGMPPGSRGSYAYDPESTTWELRASIWTPTPVDEQAVGEAFEGYASFRSRDNGTSQFRGGGGIVLLACLNAGTYTSDARTANRRHVGRIMYDVEAMVADAQNAITVLCQAWGMARTQEIEVPRALTIEDAIPGFWRYCLGERRGELVGVLPGRSERHVEALSEAYHSERRDRTRVVRADMAQAWTRYVQGQPTPVRREAEAAIASWTVKGSKVAYLEA